MMQKSSISKIFLDDREFYVKRDDLIHPFLSGNKFRKLYALFKTPNKNLKTIISYGGIQSNAMLAIAALCKKKNWEFIYYTKPLNNTAKEQKFGNFYESLQLGMIHKEIDADIYKQFIAGLELSCDAMTFLLHQGGADVHAKEGIKMLAQEIQNENLDIKSIALPSGTGTTALYLAALLPEFTIYTTPCVGDVTYLKAQMNALDEIPKNLIFLESMKKYQFAKPYKEFLEIYEKLKRCSIEFDLIYAPLMWKMILEHTCEKLLYIHTGGVSGNKTMLMRYENKNFRV